VVARPASARALTWKPDPARAIVLYTAPVNAPEPPFGIGLTADASVEGARSVRR
jgi:hypothetical protein